MRSPSAPPSSSDHSGTKTVLNKIEYIVRGPYHIYSRLLLINRDDASHIYIKMSLINSIKSWSRRPNIEKRSLVFSSCPPSRHSIGHSYQVLSLSSTCLSLRVVTRWGPKRPLYYRPNYRASEGVEMWVKTWLRVAVGRDNAINRHITVRFQTYVPEISVYKLPAFTHFPLVHFWQMRQFSKLKIKSIHLGSIMNRYNAQNDDCIKEQLYSCLCLVAEPQRTFLCGKAACTK